MRILAEGKGFEPSKGYKPLHAFQACDFNRSSTLPFFSAITLLERVKGIEPSTEAWEAAVLPLNYTRCVLHNAWHYSDFVPCLFGFVGCLLETIFLIYDFSSLVKTSAFLNRCSSILACLTICAAQSGIGPEPWHSFFRVSSSLSLGMPLRHLLSYESRE